MPYIGKAPVSGGFHKLDNLTASATATYALTLGGAAYYPETANQLLVSLNGVIQAPQDSFTVSGSNLVFDSALTASDSIDFVVALGDVLGVGTPTDGTITTAKIANGAVTDAKIDTMAASKLTGALPAIDGSNLTDLNVYTLDTEIDLTSSNTFTGIPSGTNWVEVMVRDMSTGGTEDMGIQLGTSGGIVTTGYVNSTAMVAPSTAVEGHTDAFRFTYNTGAAATMQGIIHLRRMSGNNWIMMGQVSDTANNQMHFGAGKVALTGELTQIKIDPDGNTFDNGDANIAYGS